MPETIPALPISKTVGMAVARMLPVPGWFSEGEGSLLAYCATQAGDGAFVEIGSCLGRSTIALASVVQVLHPEQKVTSIDPHLGVPPGNGIPEAVSPTAEKFRENITAAGLNGQVRQITGYSTDVEWDEPIALLHIDGDHEYESARDDFRHFAPWFREGTIVLFHDYDNWQTPGVTLFVDETLAGGGWERIGREGVLIALRATGA